MLQSNYIFCSKITFPFCGLILLLFVSRGPAEWKSLRRSLYDAECRSSMPVIILYHIRDSGWGGPSAQMMATDRA